MTLWKIERAARTPHKDPDPATASFSVILRETETGKLDTVLVAMALTAVTDPAALTNVVCEAAGVTHTPNDFNCP